MSICQSAKGQSHGQRGHCTLGLMTGILCQPCFIPYKNKVWKGLSSFPDVKTEAQGRKSFAKALGHFRIKVMCPGD